MPQKRRYGWLRDLPDHRDFPFLAPRSLLVLPDSVDLRPQCPPIYDQGKLGSCTAHAISAAFDFENYRQTGNFLAPSRLFLYYNERDMEGTVTSDAGAQIRDGIKSVASLGLCPESDWSYDPDKFSLHPPPNCYADAVKHTSLSYWSVNQNISDFKACLAQGFPFAFGFAVYESFEDDSTSATGEVSMPDQSETMLGGHAVLAVGYDDVEDWIVCRNSWGADWGDSGYFYLPYPYVSSPKLASDFWTIRAVT